jgi:hypothetical protein
MKQQELNTSAQQTLINSLLLKTVKLNQSKKEKKNQQNNVNNLVIFHSPFYCAALRR